LESVIRLVQGGSCLLLNLVFCDAADGGGKVYGEHGVCDPDLTEYIAEIYLKSL